MTSQLTADQLTDLLVQATEGTIVLCSEAQYDEWMDEADQADANGEDIPDGNPLAFGYFPEDMIIVDGQDFRGINLQALREAYEDHSRPAACIFEGCNFAGINGEDTVLEISEFRGCDLTGSVGI